MNNWPDETRIDATGLNGEADAPTYKIDETLWRINPVGDYAFYWHKGIWRVSGYMTNAAVRLNGSLQC